MATIDQQLAALNQTLTTIATQNGQILTAVQGLSPAKAEDLTPVTDAVTAVQSSVGAVQTAVTTLQTSVNGIAAKLPVDAPAAS